MAKQYNSYRYSTPVCTLNYIKVVEPDTKYGAPTYQITIEAPEEQAKKMIAAMEALDPRYVGKIPFTVKDGIYSFKVKQKRYITWYDKKNGGRKVETEQIPTVLNADNTPYVGKDPWGGSTGEVGIGVDVSRNPAGDMIVALRLKGVRFHDIKTEGTGGSGDPLFGSPAAVAATQSAASQAEEGPAEDDLPFDVDSGEDDEFFS